MIIKAGTYRWNDEIDFSSHPRKILINILVKPSPVINQAEMTITADTSSSVRFGIIYPNSVTAVNRDVTLLYAEKEFAPVRYYIYDDIYGWNAAVGQFTELGFTVDSAFNGFGKEFEVEEDTEVDETTGTWFTSNTTMLIKAGTYRFNDVLTFSEELPGSSIAFTFSLPPITFQGQTVTFNAVSIFPLPGNSSLTYYNAEHNSLIAYNQANGFNAMAGLAGDESLNGYGQIITVTYDQYVPTDFGLWANENWKKQGEEEEPDTCPTLEDYLADFNDTYIDGILYTEGEAFMDYLLDADIDLHTSIYDYVVGDLIIDELRLLNPSLYNELYVLGYSAGEIAGEASGYDEGLIVGREEGWQNGYNAGASSSFGENLIVDLFDAPIQVIDNIVLYENTVAGVTFTVSLWNVLTSVIIICILTWILKLISGG